jgi:gas vesicle protein
MSTGKALLGLLAGIAAGATLGILLAPEKGSKTRGKIIQKGDDYVASLEEKFNDLAAKFTEKLDSVRKESKQMLANGEAKAEEIKSAITR